MHFIFDGFATRKIQHMTKGSKIRWLSLSVAGLLLTGAGICMCIDAGFVRSRGGEWFWYGTFSLVVFQSGLCLMIDSIRYRMR
jgi:hypothetical protein